jgi:Domain of unknown function (DUF3883)
MPQSIPPGLKKEHVLQALNDLDGGIDHPFGAPTGYELLHDGKRYAPKAVVGLACRYHLGRVLQPEEFSGGEAPGQANFILRKLGFTVVRKGEEAAEEEKPAHKDWSEQEVGLIVADYFTMLEKELLGKPFSKTEHRRSLAPKLAGRSDGSIEFKHANISAVLTGLGLPYVEGYKPRGNCQSLLAQEVEAFLDKNPTFMEQLAGAPTLNPDKAPTPDALDLDKIIEEPPAEIIGPIPGKPWLSRKGRKIDFAQLDALNRQLGKLGEEFVVHLERHRLVLAGRDDLSRKVQCVAVEIGDGLSFDVLSFDDQDESEKLIEVKTTGLGKFFPFHVTGNEVRCSEDMTDKFHLFRVFDFGRTPRVYILTGSLKENCLLEPIQFRATI